MTRANDLRRIAAAAAMALLFAARAAAQEHFALDAERLEKALALKSGQTVADIGAGAGELTVLLARIVGPAGHVYGTEIEERWLRAIRRAADGAELKNVTVIEGHATRTNLPVGCCDALVVRFVYHHFKDPAPMNASMRESLKPGGLVAIIDFPPEGAESANPARRASGDQHGVTPATVVRELRHAGFEEVSVDEATRGNRGYLVVMRRPAS